MQTQRCHPSPLDLRTRGYQHPGSREMPPGALGSSVFLGHGALGPAGLRSSLPEGTVSRAELPVSPSGQYLTVACSAWKLTNLIPLMGGSLIPFLLEESGLPNNPLAEPMALLLLPSKVTHAAGGEGRSACEPHSLHSRPGGRGQTHGASHTRHKHHMTS